MQNIFDVTTFLSIKNLDNTSKEKLTKNIIEYILICLFDDLSKSDYLRFKKEIEKGDFSVIDKNKVKIYMENFRKVYKNE